MVRALLLPIAIVLGKKVEVLCCKPIGTTNVGHNSSLKVV